MKVDHADAPPHTSTTGQFIAQGRQHLIVAGALVPLCGFRAVPDCWAIDWAAFPADVLA